MSTITIAVPDLLDAALVERMNAVGASSKEEYLLSLVESDCTLHTLDQTLVERINGPFEALPSDWKLRVREAASGRE